MLVSLSNCKCGKSGIKTEYFEFEITSSVTKIDNYSQTKIGEI
jgi:hypothetical protein